MRVPHLPPRNLLILGTLLANVGSAGAFNVVTTTPTHYQLNVATTTTTIAVEFNETPVLAPSAAFRVAGCMSGLHAGSLVVAGNSLLFQVSAPFFPGELVTVNLRNDVRGMGGSTLTGGYHFAFTTAAAPSPTNWLPPMIFDTANIPYFIHGGDLDGDRKPDLAVPNEGTNDVSIFLNTAGTGEFPSHAEHPVGTRPSSIFGEDFDNDGDQDLATADIISGTVSILRNSGNGSFANVGTLSAGFQTRQIHGGDFDGDNDIDLCATSNGTDEIYLFYNNGNGTFGLSISINVESGPFAIRTGDFDLDGHLDIAVGCQGTDNLYVLRNDGTGSFTHTGSYPIENGPWCLNGSDFDADGDFDLISVASFSNKIVVLLNDGSGAFGTRNITASGAFPLGVFAADLDGDGDIDATSSNFNDGTVSVFHNNGSGVLSLSTTLHVARTGSYTWAHDLDGDGDLDLSVVDELADKLYVFLNASTSSTESPPDNVDGEAPGRPALQLWPNPLRDSGELSIRLVGLHTRDLVVLADIAHVDIIRVDGQRVRRLPLRSAGASALALQWDGRDASGRRVAAGRYYVTTTITGRRIARPLQIIR